MKQTVLVLGYFDAVHLGHRELIKTALRVANERGDDVCVTLFSGDLTSALRRSGGTVYTESEKRAILSVLGVKRFLELPTSAEFLSKTKDEFLEYIRENLFVSAFVCGKDFTFGKNAEGRVDDLLSFAKENRQTVYVVDDVIRDGEKVSTTKIKAYLSSGNVEKANAFLGEPYHVFGSVESGRGVGKTLGFPTVNLKLKDGKFYPKYGVYAGFVSGNGWESPAVIHFGPRPTFGVDSVALEAFLIGFNGDLYGENLTVSFTAYLRDIRAFDSEKELILQIEKDVSRV